MLVLDSGAVSALAADLRRTAARIAAFRDEGLWPPLVPSVVLVECLTGDSRDAQANRLLKTCDLIDGVPIPLARRAAVLRTGARRGSAVDALVVALAEPGGTVLTGDEKDLRALADGAADVSIQRI